MDTVVGALTFVVRPVFGVEESVTFTWEPSPARPLTRTELLPLDEARHPAVARNTAAGAG